MNKEDILKKAIVLYHQDQKNNSQYEKESLNELNIPDKYYNLAKEELLKNSKKKKNIFILIFVLIFLFFINFYTIIFEKLPVVTDFKYELVKEGRAIQQLIMNFKIINNSSLGTVQIKYELYTPDGRLYERQLKDLYRSAGAEDFQLRVNFISNPVSGEWNIKLSRNYEGFLSIFKEEIFNRKIMFE